MKIVGLPIKLLCFFLCLMNLPSKAQDTTYYDRVYEPVNARFLARFMEIKKCAVDDPNKCSVGTFSLDSNRIIFNWRYSDYERGIRHGRCSKWYKSGALHEETMYEEGKKHGLQKSFYPNGQLKKQLQWEKDSIIGAAFYNEDGTTKTDVFKEDLYESFELEIEPSFPNGLQAMYMYLNQNVRYPEEAKEQQIQGQVILSFVVGKTGEISDVRVVQTPHRCLSDAVTGAVKRMPRWSPGRLSGFPIRVRYTLPFKFKLE